MVKIDISDSRTKLLVISVVIFLLVLIGWTSFVHDESASQNKETEIVIVNGEDENITVFVELANTSEQRRKGLMNRDSLCEECGMLFVYEQNTTGGFWMKDTTIPLSIAFISENGTIIDIQQMEPETLDTHNPGVPYRYALEVNQGFYDEKSINEGDMIYIPEDIDAE